MTRVMFPFSEAELAKMAQTEQKQRREWIPTGFFKGGWRAIRDASLTRNNRSYLYRIWLETTFTEPTPAREVFQLARREGFSVWGLRRARIRLGVKTKRAGGKGTGRKNPWIWHFPVAK